MSIVLMAAPEEPRRPTYHALYGKFPEEHLKVCDIVPMVGWSGSAIWLIKPGLDGEPDECVSVPMDCVGTFLDLFMDAARNLKEIDNARK